jgi:hypothetical protein
MASLSGNSGSGGDDDGSDGYTVPLIGLAVSVLSFGMFAVPMKLPAVVAADCAPVRPHAPWHRPPALAAAWQAGRRWAPRWLAGRLRSLTHRPSQVIYQLYMSVGIMLSSWLVLAWEPFAFTWWGLPAWVQCGPHSEPQRRPCATSL